MHRAASVLHLITLPLRCLPSSCLQWLSIRPMPEGLVLMLCHLCCWGKLQQERFEGWHGAASSHGLSGAVLGGGALPPPSAASPAWAWGGAAVCRAAPLLLPGQGWGPAVGFRLPRRVGAAGFQQPKCSTWEAGRGATRAERGAVKESLQVSELCVSMQRVLLHTGTGHGQKGPCTRSVGARCQQRARAGDGE